VKSVSEPRATAGPLTGIRVLDFTWVRAGATGTRFLADFGAEVIKVESAQSPDPIRFGPPFAERKVGINRSGWFNNVNRNKKSIALNMHHPTGVEIAKRLVAASDVVTENFTPGTMEAWGLGYEDLKLVKPDIIYCAVSGYGPGGRNSRYTSWGPTAQATSGMTAMSGLPGHEPAGWGYSHLDLMPGYLMAVAVLAALHRSRVTGEGAAIDISQIETGIFLSGPRILDFSVNGRPYPGPNGNRAEFLRVAPHNTYACRGEDRWVAIVCRSDDEWRAMTVAMKRPELAADPRFRSNEDRLAHEDELDRDVATWTSGLDAYEVMDTLQAAGVPCGVVQDARDKIERDPQLAHRGFLSKADHPEIGEHRFEGAIPRLTRTPGSVRRGAPLIGEHTEQVLREVLGMDGAEIEEVTASGACQ